MWTEQQDTAAKAFGWCLRDTFNNGDTKPHLRVADAGMFRSDHDAGLHVVAAAKRGDKLAQAALQAVMASAYSVKPKRKK